MPTRKRVRVANQTITTTGQAATTDVINFPQTVQAGHVPRTRLEAIVGTDEAGLSIGATVGQLSFRAANGQGLTQEVWSLEHVNYIQTASQDAGGNWANIANAEGEEPATGDFASLTGQALLQQGTLRGTHAPQPNRTALTIDTVELEFWYESTILGLGASLDLGFRIGDLGVDFDVISHGILATIPDHYPSGNRVDITAHAGAPLGGWTWADIADLQTYFSGLIAVDLVGDLRAYGAAVHVAASLTETY